MPTQSHRSTGPRLGGALSSALAILMSVALSCATAGAAETVAPLPASDYSVQAVCAAPTPTRAGCLALQLVPKTAAALARTHPLGMTRSGPVASSQATEGVFGLRPLDLHSAYQLPDATLSTQTIALVDAYDDAKAEADLATYDSEFGLPPCTEANGCFRKVNQAGSRTPLPSSTSKEAKAWAGEIATDVEVAHAVCQNCHILLVEASLPEYTDLAAAEETAVKLGAGEISDSWGGPEAGGDSPAFDHTGVVITAAAGDDGYLDWDAKEAAERGLPDYPATSPNVIAVGGTRLTLAGLGGARAQETVWNGDGAGGGGCSTLFKAQPWQQSVADWAQVGCPENHRAAADVSADSDPYTGVAVYDSTPFEGRTGWGTIGGTSVASPIIASVFALAGGAHGVAYPARTLYENLLASPGSLYDVVSDSASGSNGACGQPFDEATGVSGCTLAEEDASCSARLICLAGKGYDGPSGVGTPNGTIAFRPGGAQALAEEEAAAAARSKAEAERQAEARQAEERQAEAEAAAEARSRIGSPAEPLLGATAGQLSPGAGAGLSGPASAGASEPIAVLSRLSLTRSATAALQHSHPRAVAVAFTFALSAAARVRVELAEQVHSSGRTRWQSKPGTLTMAAAKGRNGGHWHARGNLAPGRYRLTLTPLHGVARSLTFQIG
jgi:Subtilase family